MNSGYNYSLQGCVSSMRMSLELLTSSTSSLDFGVNDLSRMKTVLKSDRVFEVVPESEVNAVKLSLAGEVEPQIIDLLKRAESGISKLERRQKNLVSKAELQDVRLQRQPSASAQAAGRALDSPDMDKWKALHQKKERLEFTLSRLEMTAGQKQRQLRILE